jgi:hypothetical protein
MWRAGFVREALESALLDHNRLWCRPQLPEEEVRRIAASVARFPEPPPWALSPTRWAIDVGMAYVLGPAERHVLIWLAAGANDNGHVTRGPRRLMEETRLSVNTVLKALHNLEATEIIRKISVDPRFGTTYEIARIYFDLGEGEAGGGRPASDMNHPAAGEAA